MNIIDLLIIFLLLAAIIRGRELGFVRQLFSTVGFFAGLVLGALIEPHVIGLAHSSVSRVFITLLTTLGMALLVLTIGEMIGVFVKQKLQYENKLNYVDNTFGAGLAAISLLVLVWLSAAILVTLPSRSIQSSVRNSVIVSALNRTLPPAPGVIADIGHLIAPNGFPNVFIGAEPSPSTASLPPPAELAAAVGKDRMSVVKIEGQGCGGIVEGSGFVVSPTLVATAAHVVAGIDRPFVLDDLGQHRATAVWFDPNLDFAVLSVNGLAGGPLPFNAAQIAHGTPGGILGYPGGGAFTADSAAVLDEFTAVGRNIYNQGQTEREVYSVRANVIPGNSGGPLIDVNGNVIGVVFATSTSYNDVGYALSVHQVLSEIAGARASNTPVSTGSCAE